MAATTNDETKVNAVLEMHLLLERFARTFDLPAATIAKVSFRDGDDREISLFAIPLTRGPGSGELFKIGETGQDEPGTL